MYELDKFPSKLKEYRTKLGMNQEEFAETLDVSDKYLSSIETGNSVPSLSFLVKVSTITRIPITCYLTDKTPLINDKPNVIEYLETLDFEELKQVCKTLESYL